MNPFADQSSADVAEEAENERAGLVNTLDQLRENLRPENMVDEVFSQAKANSSDLMDRVWSVARANPIPAALIGLGAAMLLGATQRFGKRRNATGQWDTTAATPRGPEVSPAYDDAFEVSDTAWTAGPHETLRPAMDVDFDGHRPLTGLSRLLNEQPLILAALGMAVGAAVGSAIPSTEVESQLLGDASETVRRNANSMAREQLSQLRSNAGQTLDQMRATAAEHGVSSENLSGLVHDLGEDVRSAAFSATDSQQNTTPH